MNQEANSVVAMQPASAPIEMTDPGATHTANMLMNPVIMQQLSNFAAMMATGKSTIPQHLRGNQGDCMAVAMQAAQWGMNPYAVAQKTHLSQGGQLGYEAQLVNAVITSLAPIKNRPQYEFIGNWDLILGKVSEETSSKGGKYYKAAWKKTDEDGLGVIIRCTLKGEDEPREMRVMLSQCYPRFSTQWATDPQQQICYVAIKKWARRNTPDVILGVYTPDEFEPASQPAEREINPSAAPSSIQNKLGPKKQAQAAPVTQPEEQQNWPAIIDQWVIAFNSCETLEALAQVRGDAESFQKENDPPTDLWTKVLQAYRNTKKALEAGADPQTGEVV